MSDLPPPHDEPSEDPFGSPAPPAGGTPPPSGGTPPPSGGTPPPSGGTPPPSGGTPPPSGGTPPPSGGTPSWGDPPPPSGYPSSEPQGAPIPAAPYGQQGFPQQTTSNPTNGLAIASLVLGILSLISFWACGAGLLFGIIAVVLGILGRNKAKEMNGSGAGLALGGLITGAIGAIATIVFVLVVWVWADDVSNNIDGVNTDPSDGTCDMDRFIQDPDC